MFFLLFSGVTMIDTSSLANQLKAQLGGKPATVESLKEVLLNPAAQTPQLKAAMRALRTPITEAELTMMASFLNSMK